MPSDDKQWEQHYAELAEAYYKAFFLKNSDLIALNNMRRFIQDGSLNEVTPGNALSDLKEPGDKILSKEYQEAKNRIIQKIAKSIKELKNTQGDLFGKDAADPIKVNEINAALNLQDQTQFVDQENDVPMDNLDALANCFFEKRLLQRAYFQEDPLIAAFIEPIGNLKHKPEGDKPAQPIMHEKGSINLSEIENFDEYQKMKADVIARIKIALNHYIEGSKQGRPLTTSGLFSQIDGINFLFDVKEVTIKKDEVLNQLQAAGKGEISQGAYYGFELLTAAEIQDAANLRAISGETITKTHTLMRLPTVKEMNKVNNMAPEEKENIPPNASQPQDSRPKPFAVAHHYNQQKQAHMAPKKYDTVLQELHARFAHTQKESFNFVVTDGITALQSTASPIIDTWSEKITLKNPALKINYHPVETAGGATQLHVNPKDNDKITPQLRSDWLNIIKSLPQVDLNGMVEIQETKADQTTTKKVPMKEFLTQLHAKYILMVNKRILANPWKKAQLIEEARNDKLMFDSLLKQIKNSNDHLYLYNLSLQLGAAINQSQVQLDNNVTRMMAYDALDNMVKKEYSNDMSRTKGYEKFIEDYAVTIENKLISNFENEFTKAVEYLNYIKEMQGKSDHKNEPLFKLAIVQVLNAIGYATLDENNHTIPFIYNAVFERNMIEEAERNLAKMESAKTGKKIEPNRISSEAFLSILIKHKYKSDMQNMIAMLSNEDVSQNQTQSIAYTMVADKYFDNLLNRFKQDFEHNAKEALEVLDQINDLKINHPDKNQDILSEFEDDLKEIIWKGAHTREFGHLNNPIVTAADNAMHLEPGKLTYAAQPTDANMTQFVKALKSQLEEKSSMTLTR